jgi:hypothetical protein
VAVSTSGERASPQLAADVDYWLDESIAESDRAGTVHQAIANALIPRAVELESQLEDTNHQVQVIGTVGMDGPQPLGFADTMHKVGPRFLEVVGSDDFDIAKGGRLLTLYQVVTSLSRQAPGTP